MSTTLKHELLLEVYGSTDELNQDDAGLLKKAIEASANAYAPYSHFPVGAAVLMENGKIITGNNQENAAYPSGLCAERVAIFQASSLFPMVRMKAIAVYADSKKYSLGEPVTPCGSCRQSLYEYEHKFCFPIRVIMGGKNGKVFIAPSVNSLLPFAFGNDGKN